MPSSKPWSASVRHDLSVEGHGFQLRPAYMPDAEFIVEIRNDPDLGEFIQRGANTVTDQMEWMNTYFSRVGDYLFIVERKDGTAEGIVGVYEVNKGAAEWGRWVLRRGSLAAVESALGAYRVGFELLDLERVYCRTVAANVHVVSFHDSCGLRRTNRPGLEAQIGSKRLAMVEHELTRDSWPAVRERLDRQAFRIASRLD